jgi:hypothetical protein
MTPTARVALWLLVIFLGMSVGAGLYEARIMVPLWRETPPADWINTGTRFWAFVTSGPLTVVLAVSVFLAWRASGPARGWWLAALAVSAVERIATFAYFIPTMYGLQNQTGGLDDPAASVFESWVALNHLRHVLSIAAWLLALRAMSLLAASAGRLAAAGERA